jgi:hypothetical protein
VKLWNLSYFLAVVACGLMEFVIYFFSSKFVNFFFLLIVACGYGMMGFVSVLPWTKLALPPTIHACNTNLVQKVYLARFFTFPPSLSTLENNKYNSHQLVCPIKLAAWLSCRLWG